MGQPRLPIPMLFGWRETFQTVDSWNPIFGEPLPQGWTYDRVGTAYRFSSANSYVQAGPNVPRSSHRAQSGAAPGMLIEPFAQNLVTESHRVANYEIDGGGTLTDTGVQPVGLVGSFRAVAGSGSAVHFFRPTPSINFTDATDYTAQLIFRNEDAFYLAVRGFIAAAQWCWVVIDPANGQIQTSTPSVQNPFVRNLGGGFFQLQFSWTTTSAGTSKLAIFFTDQQAPPDESVNQADPFTGSGESFIHVHQQIEASPYGTSPIPTTGAASTRSADNLSPPNDWFATASAAIDTTVAPVVIGTNHQTRQNMLGFGSSDVRNFQVSSPNQVRLKNGSGEALATASSSYEGERHGFGMSQQANEQIVVDDEDNDNTNTNTNTPTLGAVQVGLSASLGGLPGIYHRIRIGDQTLTVEQLKAIVAS